MPTGWKDRLIPGMMIFRSSSNNVNDTPVQTDPPAGSAFPAAIEIEIQSRLSELRHELLDDRAAYIDRWLFAITIFLAMAGFIGFRRFREIETEAKNSVETVTKLVAEAEGYVEEIKEKREEAEEIIRNMNSEIAAEEPEKARQAVADVRENPKASPIDKAIADAVSLQQQGKSDEAIEKWRAIAQVVEGSDNDLAARAWFSVGYLLQDRDPEKCLLVYDRAIRLNPSLAEAYNNRGVAKAALERHEDAIADFDEAIRLNPDHVGAYNNRGNAKAALERHEDAIADFDQALYLKPDYTEAYYNRGIAKAALGQYAAAIPDYDEAIRLNPDLAGAYYNRGIAKATLGLKDEARKDLETALELARNAGNEDSVAQVEQLLRDLDADGGP